MIDVNTIYTWGVGSYYASPFIAIAIFFALVFCIEIGTFCERRSTLKYVWTVGVPHTQKEYNQLYLKWKNNIRD